MDTAKLQNRSDLSGLPLRKRVGAQASRPGAWRRAILGIASVLVDCEALKGWGVPRSPRVEEASPDPKVA